MKRLTYIISLFIFISAPILAQLEIVKDISAEPTGSDPVNFTEHKGAVYFAATGPEGRELWKSEGTGKATMLVKDIHIGFDDSRPMQLISIGDWLYFTADDGIHGRELWKTDGTEKGTQLVKDIFPGFDGSNISGITPFGKGFIFSAEDGINGKELWISDGTEAGTKLLKDINPGKANSFPSSLIVFGSDVYFTATTSASGTELWKTDGTAKGTVMVKDIVEGENSSWPDKYIVMNDMLYFSAFTHERGEELWKSDGTSDGTVLVKDIFPGNNGSRPSNMIIYKDLLYFTANNGSNGNELWKSDGTAKGTVMVKDINAGTGSGNPSDFTLFEGLIFFTADDGVNGKEVWSTDGVEATTLMRFNINEYGSSASSYLTVGNGNLFLSAFDGTNYSLYIIYNIGKILRIKSLGSFENQPAYLAFINDLLYFNVDDNVHSHEPWISDGTIAGTVLLKDVLPGNADSYIQNFTRVGDMQYFTLNKSLWRTDGTEKGTYIVKSFDNIDQLIAYGKSVLFGASDNIHGNELWISDGTETGTLLVKDINPGSGDSYINNLTAFNKHIYFNAYNEAHGMELWRTDGTPEGTTIVKDIIPGADSGDPTNLTVINNTMFFRAKNKNGYELWNTDGTESGTVMIKDILPGAEDSHPYMFTAVGESVFFQAKSENAGNQLWKTDGTEKGTVMVKNLSTSGCDMDKFTAFKDHLVFEAWFDDVKGIWVSDGTSDGTVLFHDMSLDIHRYIFQIIAMNDHIYIFTFNKSTMLMEIWRNDGTPDGIELFGEYPRPYAYDIPKAMVFDNAIWFVARPAPGNKGLWRITPGDDEPELMALHKSASCMELLGHYDDKIYLKAKDIRGNELWKYTIEGSTGIRNPGLKDGNNPMSISVWPNPFNNKISIELPKDISGSYTIEIMDIAGRVWISSSSEHLIGNTQQIETGHLQKGIYVVLLSGNGYNYYTKIMKR